MQENLHHRLPEPKMGEVAGKGPQLVSPKEMLLSFCAVKQLMNLALGEGCLLWGVGTNRIAHGVLGKVPSLGLRYKESGPRQGLCTFCSGPPSLYFSLASWELGEVDVICNGSQIELGDTTWRNPAPGWS